MSEVFNPVMKNSLQYMNIKPGDVEKLASEKVPVLAEKTVEEAKKAVQDKGLEAIVVGNGKKIVQQLPLANSAIMQGQKVILMTDGEMTAPDMVTWSKDDALKVSEITGIPFEFSGSGYVKEQSILRVASLIAKRK